MMLRSFSIHDSPSCCPTVLIVRDIPIRDKGFCLKTSLKTLRMELYALCACDLKENAEALSVLPSAEEYSLLSSNSKGKAATVSAFRCAAEICHFFIGSNPDLH